MKIKKIEASRADWDHVRSWNYKLKDLKDNYQSVVYAELDGIHGEVATGSVERVYYILSGAGEFNIGGENVHVEAGDVLTVPPHTTYDYWPTNEETLKVILFMELWDN
ncbi:MAG: AraC family ligand binding domain-containing protein [Parcubacteria group bacterium]|jgi:mannose-6-phosphate isomerase-like protein (cupin superfamily)